MQKAILSKSSFIKGLQCEKYLYLYKHHYDWQDPISTTQQAIFDKGHKVGELARDLFPNGVLGNPYSPREYNKAVELTKELIANGEKVIYEAAFMYNQVLIIADIMVKHGSKWKVYEVKSSTSISETYLNDISVQYYVISNSGLHISDISIVYINNEYVRHGKLELDQLFNIESLLEFAIEKQEWVSEEVERLKNVVALKEIPNVDIGMQCTDPYQCAFIGYCWNDIPENSVFDISRMHRRKKFELYEQGIVSLEDIPEDYELPASQKLQIDSYINGKTTINEQAIKEFLKTINYPLYYMDFETFQPAIPLFDNSKPYQQIPFQFSLHYQKSKDSTLQHSEFLAEAGQDPRPEFIERLLKDTKEPGDMLVYNKSFEITRLKEIARDFPKYTKEINERILRIKDLMIPFQRKWYYTPEMQGSYSIKYVLPALVPELSYDELEIKEGGSASMSFEGLFSETDLFKVQETRKNLLEYCKMDTLAMVEILNTLQMFI